MNPTDYTFLLSHPEAVNERQTDALEAIVTEFPYFQSARALRLKGLYNQNSFQYNYALKVTAAYTTDRSVLFDFITSDSFTAIQKGLYEQKASEVDAIMVKGSEIVTEESRTHERPTDSELAKQSILTSIREAENRPEGAETIGAEPAENTEAVSVEEVPTAIEADINPEDFGPVYEEPQFLPEAVPPMEFGAIDTIEFVRVENVESDDKKAGQTDAEIGGIESIESETESVLEISPAENKHEPADSARSAQDLREPKPESADAQAETQKSAEQINEESQAAMGLSETKLEIGKPLEFSKDETHSFQEWLQLSRLQPIVRDETPPNSSSQNDLAEKTNGAGQAGKTTKDALIDRFIESNPKMPRMKADAEPVPGGQPVNTNEVKEDHSALMTETLARVYLEQRKYQKAIQAYEILILKYPEKSTFFADRISEIKNLQQNNTL